MNFEFHSPYFLYLFLLFIPLLFLDFRKKKEKGIAVPTIQKMEASSLLSVIFLFLKLTKYFILSSIIIALARPRTFTALQDRDEKKGVDIMLSLDISPSMLAKDFDPDRITALKKIAKNFIKARETDRIGLVEYWGEGFMRVPLTSDHQIILEEIDLIEPDFQNFSGTAMGEGLSVAVSHIRNSKAKSKIIILISDGENNVIDAFHPLDAALLAKNYGIKVYTIGIGTNGIALFPHPAGGFYEEEVRIDEQTLLEIAQITGGKYYRATSNESLEGIYNEINLLEKSPLKTAQKVYNYVEYFRVFLWFALVLLLIDAVLRWRVFRIFN